MTKMNIYPAVLFKTEGDFQFEKEELKQKLDIIKKYFPFNNVTGYYDAVRGVELTFDNNIEVKGVFNREPFLVSFSVNGNLYEIDIHPFDTLGGFDNLKFEADIKMVQKEEDTVSLVIGHDGYAEKSISVRKADLDNLKIYLVCGTQVEGKLLGLTAYGTGDFKEK
jgi:hypothetical protein